ncbi:hypothetical protein BGW39_009448 [Mortierella sp. 14UC]|nr:hypothetical protein BGW39_009448 [Mortierella sp. 14UC]
MRAFAKSLQFVHVHYREDFHSRPWQEQNQQDIGWLAGRDLSLSRQILKLPLANSIGDWPFPLPFLKAMTFYMPCAASLRMGSFDQCPNLEQLHLYFGNITTDSPHSPPHPTEPAPHDDDVDHGSLEGDPRCRAPLDPSLYPKWTLPKLRILTLQNELALRFDYDSLEGMPNLQYLTLTVDTRTDLLSRLQDIPRLSTHARRYYPHLATTSPREATTEEGATLDTSETSTESATFTPLASSHPWTRTWTLLKLTNLTLSGPPATVFTFDWLKGCPNVETLELTLPDSGSFQRLPMTAAFSPEDTIALNTKEQQQKHQEEEPAFFKESRLETLQLDGPWILDASDLAQLLIEYAPYLKALNIHVPQERPEEEGMMSAVAFLKAFQGADQILRHRFGPAAWDARPENERETEPGQAAAAVTWTTPAYPSQSVSTKNLLPGRSLLRITANYPMQDGQAQEADMEEVQDEEDYHRQFKAGIRYYSLHRRLLIAKRDKAWFDVNMAKFKAKSGLQ